MSSLNVAYARSQFPALTQPETPYIFADNAGGSQCLSTVASKITDYLLNTNVQLGADYSVSVTSTNRVKEGVEAAKELFNASSVDEISFGSSSTMLAENLARAIDKDVLDDEEFIVTGEHEANGGPWKKLAARRNLKINYWHATHIPTSPNNPYAVSLKVEDLLPLVTSKTRLVAFTACSNILGSVVPVKEIVAALRSKAMELGNRKLEVSIDCVAYAPHRRIDVQDWDVDYCFFSMYKVYGPHTSVLYTRSTSLQTSLASLAHHFLKVDSISYKIQPGGQGYELTYGCTAIPLYLKSLSPSGTLEESFKLIAAHEQELIKPLLEYLKSKESEERGVRIVGDEEVGPLRVPTISFIVVGPNAKKSQDIVRVFDRKGNVGIRWGHFYAYTLVDTLDPKVDINDAVVRISLVHYNTVEEVNEIIEILKEALA
ncbi:pyridoxal phosphate-dependent transferase [Abortiporus biennis]|nr:pyridoxal phosphate-dependent transferase [Abortiporus biennis]